MTERLYRHPSDRVIAGVAGGMAAWLHLDPSLVRVAWVLLAIFSGGLLVVVYLVMMIVVPLAPPGSASPAGSWPSAPSGPPASPAAPGAPGSTWGTPPPGGWPAQGVRPPVSAGGAGIVAGVILVVLGVWFLLDQVIDMNWGLVWPILIMLAGGVIIARAIRRGRAS